MFFSCSVLVLNHVFKCNILMGSCRTYIHSNCLYVAG
uniref:Uncharacterized protein n=1 Tax=Anguilla anguilla TaxID=7936 RepID=A0A0E9Y136_ANGAN